MTEQERFEQWHRENIGEPYCVGMDFWRVGVDYAWAAWKAAKEESKDEIERKDIVLKNVIDTYKRYYGNATDLHIEMQDVSILCEKALSNKEAE